MARKPTRSNARKTKGAASGARGRNARPAPARGPRRPFRPLRLAGFILLRSTTILIVGIMVAVLATSFMNPPTNWYMASESRRLGGVDHQWVPIESVAPVMVRSAVAAEDANFCLHWGFDVEAIRQAMEDGSARGGSTISQQVVKNVFLWHGRNWARKVLEAAITPAVEAVWSKRRILEVYLNVAEFDEGVFGIEAAARHYFGVGPERLTAQQAARLAAILPSPKTRSAAQPSAFVRQRAASIQDGAALIRADGRAS